MTINMARKDLVLGPSEERTKSTKRKPPAQRFNSKRRPREKNLLKMKELVTEEICLCMMRKKI